MSEIGRRRFDLDRRARQEREELLQNHREKFDAEYRLLRADCENIGHVFGRAWDNGLGWQWSICGRCGGSYDKKCYLEETP